MSSKPLCTCNAGMQYESRIEDLEKKDKVSVSLVEQWSNKWAQKNSECIDLKSRIAELERENAAERSDHIAKFHEQGLRLAKSQQLNEKLMGELEEQIRSKWRILNSSLLLNQIDPPMTEDEYWQSYCREKGLTPNKKL